MLDPRNQVSLVYPPQEHGFALSGSPAENDLLYTQYARSRGIPLATPVERAHLSQIQTREDGTRFVDHRSVPSSSSPRRRSSPALRRSARLQQQALETENQMPGLLTPPDSPPAPASRPKPRPMKGYPSWPRWYDALSPHFALHADSSSEHPGTNCVERAILRGALSVARRDVSIVEQEDLILHIIRDTWMAAILCRNAAKDPEP